MPFDANGCLYVVMNVVFYGKFLNEHYKSVNEGRLNKINVNEFKVGVSD